jgi:catalase
MSARKYAPLTPTPCEQVLTEEDQHRLANLGANGDLIDKTVWGQWTSSVKNRQATAEEVLGGMKQSTDQAPHRSQAAGS